MCQNKILLSFVLNAYLALIYNVREDLCEYNPYAIASENKMPYTYPVNRVDWFDKTEWVILLTRLFGRLH